MVRGIVKKFKTTGTVVNKPGRGRKFILPPRSVRRMVREIKKSPKLTVTELHQMVASWGHKVSKTTIRRYLHATSCLGGMHGKKPFSLKIISTNVWSGTGPSTGTVCFGQMKTKLELFGNKHSKWVWRNKKMSMQNSTSCPL